MEEKKGLKAHKTLNSHLESALKWSSYMKPKQTGTFSSRILCISRQEILENLHYIKTVAQVVTICAVPDLALRGHREGRILDDDDEVLDQDFNCGSRNRGNFLEILESYSVHDTIVRKKPHNPQNAQYVHHDIQEDLLAILAKLVRNDVLETLTKVNILLCYVMKRRIVERTSNCQCALDTWRKEYSMRNFGRFI